jgi:hypothetical protein
VENCIGTSTVVVRSATIKAIGGFDEEFEVCEDWDLWIRLARLGSVAYLEQPMTAYRLHSGNTHSNIDRMRKYRIRFHVKHANITSDRDKCSKLTKLGRNKTYLALAYSYWWIGERRQAIAEAFRAIVVRPLSIRGYMRLIRVLTPVPTSRGFEGNNLL